MGQDEAETVRRAFDALAEGGVEAMLPFVDERFEMVTPPELAAEPDTYRGHAGVRRWFDTFYEAMDEVRIVPREIETVGDRVVVSFEMVARGRTTGLELVQEATALCELEDARVRRMRFFGERDEALAAATELRDPAAEA